MDISSEIILRDLTENDLPSVVTVVKDIWEGHDYVPSIFKNWVNSEKCYPYGAFDKNDKLVGLGNLRLIKEKIAYIEGIRVDPTKQKQGIGKLLFDYAHDLAIKLGMDLIIFATYSDNLASIHIGKNLGFELITRLDVLFLEKKNFPELAESETKESERNITQLTPGEAYNSLSANNFLTNGILCIGWSFAAINKNKMPSQNSTWLSSNNNILLIQDEDKIEKIRLHEVPKDGYIWLTLYAEDETGVYTGDLLKEVISRNKDRDIKELQLFCSQKAIKVAQELNFRYWEKNPGGIVLFEKIVK